MATLKDKTAAAEALVSILIAWAISLAPLAALVALSAEGGQ